MTVGEILGSHWTATTCPQAGQPPARWVLSCHNSSVSLGAWGLWTTPEKRTVIIAPNKTKGKYKIPALKLGTWNVRTTTPGLSDNLQQVSDARKTAVMNNELCRLQVDIIALQETRLSESGIIRERDYSFFWQGKAADKTREHGIGFAMKIICRVLSFLHLRELRGSQSSKFRHLQG